MEIPKHIYAAMWAEAVKAQEEAARAALQTQESWESKACRLGLGAYKLHCFCERLVRQYNTPWLKPSRLEAGRLYLINKHHWHPKQLEGLKIEDLQLLIHEELANMKLTDNEWEPVHNWALELDCHEQLRLSARDS
ncbi:hypothetical protein JET68_02620 [Pseudomonas monteilii]|uniref:hypothetical protein n=1 Tax=Pseudomonas monteilii TaxID=76759 RepID=UPI0018E67ADB|nr:hypothetical protein [Pseudomonas monteilii]MBI6917687.1 hypothetical protein [Pseudomonas monteilii]